MVTWGWSMNTSEGVKLAKYRSIEEILKYWIWNWDIEYWREYWGIEILDEKPRFHQQDQPFRSCSSAPQSSRSLGSRFWAHLKRLLPEQKLWKPCVKNILKIFYSRLCSSIKVTKNFILAQVIKVSLTATQAVRTTRKFILRILFEDSTSPQAKCLFKAPTHHAQVYPDSVDKKDDKKSLEVF